MRLFRFAAVGVTSTLCYAITALFLTAKLHYATIEASVAAYAIAALLSYFGHRVITFRSTGDHAREAPRFGALMLCGYALALAIPLFFAQLLGWPPSASILITCIAIPLVNYMLMARVVFRGGDLFRR
ncbi:MAG: GtrA family protein [Alphaproteobacteria bacterium]|nr:GtrA family protein [Alphaproteobacteria bacterium]